MYGDFSRMTFNRRKNYTALWAQQGRMQLDADFNEQTAILLDWLRTFARDLIGAFGGHITRAGFGVKFDHQDDDLILSPGHYYVHGLRCEVPVTDINGHPIKCRYQDPHAERPYLVYLLVWERSVSARADPELLEPALGPLVPDTAVRSQVSWSLDFWTDCQAVGALGGDADAIAAEFERWNHPRRPRMMARARQVTGTDDDDLADGGTDRGYGGVENQLYRVEVHQGGSEALTIKWSRDNGSVEFGIENFAVSDGSTDVVLTTAASVGRVELEIGAYVELVDDNWQPSGSPQPLLKVIGLDRGATRVTVKLDGAACTDLSLHPYLRRWDQIAGPDGIAVTESSWIELEDGVEVQFVAHDATYQRGDYWLVPARTAIGDVVWPRHHGEPAALVPHGPDRYMAPLALVDDSGVQDLRTLFTHLAWPDPMIG